MKKLFRFILVEFYVLAVLAVTTVEAKGYVERTEEKAEELQDSEEVMAANILLSAKNDVTAGEEPDSNEALNTDEEPDSNGETNINEELNIDEEPDSNEETDTDGEPDSSEESINDVDINSDEESDEDLNLKIYFDFFGKWKNVCELFVTEYDKVNGPFDSYDKTLKINQLDKKRIRENVFDFSRVKIACLGDSVTAASNLEDEENYEQYAYPSVLKEILGAEEVYNFGIGGSSVGRYWLEPFVDRYLDIPEDTDIIIVMGGYNDGFSASKEEFGSLEERAYRTFCGDLDELMRGLKENYPNTVVFFVAPPSNSLHGYLMTQNEKLLPQEEYVKAIEILSKEYGFEYIDLYHTGFLDTYDENVVREFVPDTTHGNHEGYRVLAERFASEILKYYNKQIGLENGIDTEGDVDTENDDDTENGIDTVDGVDTANDVDAENGVDTEDDVDAENSADTEDDIDTEGDTKTEVDTGTE